MVNPILDKPLLLIIHVIKYELLKNSVNKISILSIHVSINRIG